MSDGGPEQESPGSWKSGQQIGVTLAGLILLYFCSFGPAIYIMNRVPWLATGGTGDAVAMIYFPHIWLAEHWDVYMAYAEYWAELAGSGAH